MITKITFDFLNELRVNNNREWFEENRSRYEESYEEMQALASEVNKLMAQHDQIVPRSPKQSIFRIYRDIRFSKDKTPYKSFWGGRIKRDTPILRGGYYYHVQPGNTFAAAGFWGPESKDLKLIRSHIDQDASTLDKINQDKDFRKIFEDGIHGEQLKTAPQGYSQDHSAIEWLRLKQFVVKHNFSDQEVLSQDFPDLLNNTFKSVRPFFNYMSEILTTDLNGESLM